MEENRLDNVKNCSSSTKLQKMHHHDHQATFKSADKQVGSTQLTVPSNPSNVRLSFVFYPAL